MDIRVKLVGQLRWWAAECDRTNCGCQARELLVEAADYIANGVTVQEQKEMVCITTTDDFRNLAAARAEGCYRKHYYCPSCNTEIGHQTFDAKRKFGQGTVLHSNKFPKYCHECGVPLPQPPKGE